VNTSSHLVLGVDIRLLCLDPSAIYSVAAAAARRPSSIDPSACHIFPLMQLSRVYDKFRGQRIDYLYVCITARNFSLNEYTETVTLHKTLDNRFTKAPSFKHSNMI
jgi:ribosome-interacting GTPase 1